MNTEEILKNPHRYAAIYSRKSGSNDSNTKETQYAACIKRLHEEGLQLYGYYYEEVTAVKIPIYERKEFNSLILAVKAGYFKTIIVACFDRLIRRRDDWIQTKAFLRKYGIKLIFANKPHGFDIFSPESELLINMELFNAINEAEKINDRTSSGKEISRNNGEYSSGRKCPLGYKKLPNEKKYEIKPIESLVVQYIFALSKMNLTEFNTINLSNISDTASATLTKIINNFTPIGMNSIKVSSYLEIETLFIDRLVSLLDSSYYKAEALAEIKTSLLKISDKNTVKYILTNTIYAGLLYLNASKNKNPKKNSTLIPNDAVKKTSDTSNDYIIDIDSFTATTNILGFIDNSTFETVYCYMYKLQQKIKDSTADFLLKGKIRCGCGKILYLIKPGILSCGNLRCNYYHKDTVITIILSNLVDDILKNNTSKIKEFITDIDFQITKYNSILYKENLKKHNLTTEFIMTPSDELECKIYSSAEKIEKYLNLIASYNENKSFLLDLIFVIENYNISFSSDNSYYLKINDMVVRHLLGNERLYNHLLKAFIKEVRLSYDRKKQHLFGKIKYSLKIKSSGYLSTSIH